MAPSTHFEATSKGNTPSTYQPCYRLKEFDIQQNDHHNFYMLAEHFERECGLKSMLDHMKDYRHKHHERQNQTLIGKVHILEEPSKGFNQDDDFDNFELANQVIDTCLFELNMI